MPMLINKEQSCEVTFTSWLAVAAVTRRAELAVFAGLGSIVIGCVGV